MICYGNIYRSSYAAAQLRKRLAGACDVRSAGFHPVAGRPSPQELVNFGSRMGIDLASHRSAVVTKADLVWADTIVLMDRHNWQALKKLGAESRKLIWLGAVDGGCELVDPYGLPEAEARRIMQRVHRCADAFADAVLIHRNSPRV